MRLRPSVSLSDAALGSRGSGPFAGPCVAGEHAGRRLSAVQPMAAVTPPRRPPGRPWTFKETANCTNSSPETLRFVSCTTASKLNRVAPLTWWPWRSTSARRAERSVGARCPGGRTRCPHASAAGVARSCGYGTGCGTGTRGATLATSALDSESLLISRSFGRFCSAFRDRRLPFPRQILEAFRERQ
jgi:hypothetical protein